MGVNLYVNLDTLHLVDAPGGRNPITALRFKRGDAAKLDVVFFQGNSPDAVSVGNPATLELHFGVKQRNRYDAGYLVHSSDWTMPEPNAASPVYQCSPSFNTVELDAEFGTEPGEELAEVTLMGEISWREGEGDSTSTRTFLVVVENDVNRGTEGVPTSGNPAYPLPANIVTLAALGSHALRFDQEQALTVEQKAQARANIGVEAPQAPTPVDAASVTTAIQGMSAEQVAAVALALGIPEEAVVDAASVAAAIDAMDAAQVAALQAKLEIPASAEVTPAAVAAAITAMVDPDLGNVKAALVTPSAVAGSIIAMDGEDLAASKNALGISGNGTRPEDALAYYVSNMAMPSTGVQGDSAQPFSSITEVLAVSTAARLEIRLLPTMESETFDVDLSMIAPPSSRHINLTNSGVLGNSMYRPVVSVTNVTSSFGEIVTLANDNTLDISVNASGSMGACSLVVEGFANLNLTTNDGSFGFTFVARRIGSVVANSSAMMPGTGTASLSFLNCGFGSTLGNYGVDLTYYALNMSAVTTFTSCTISFADCYRVYPVQSAMGGNYSVRNSVLVGDAMAFTSYTPNEACSYIPL